VCHERRHRKELTSFYIKIPDYHLELAVDLLADIFTGSLFDQTEIGRERSVILQEIRMVEDTPDDYIHDFFERMFWQNHPSGFPFSGRRNGSRPFIAAICCNSFRPATGEIVS